MGAEVVVVRDVSPGRTLVVRTTGPGVADALSLKSNQQGRLPMGSVIAVLAILAVLAIVVVLEVRSRKKPGAGLQDHWGTHNSALNADRMMMGGHDADGRRD